MSIKLFNILGFIAALLAMILAVTPLSNLAIIPILIAVIFGSITFFLSKKKNIKTKTIQYIFLMVIISSSFTIYKAILTKTEIIGIPKIEKHNKENLEDSLEILKDIETK